MKPLDYIILITALPMFLLNLIGYIAAHRHAVVRLGLAEPNVKPYQIIFWFCLLLIFIYRVWG